MKNKMDNQKEIMKIRKTDGVISDVQFDDGTEMSIKEAIELTKEHKVFDCNVGRRGDRETLRRNPVEDPSKALSNLPRF